MTELHISKNRVHMRLRSLAMGADLCVVIDGGDKPHIGALTLIPEQGKAHTVCLEGHREDILSARIAQKLHRELHCTVTCVCGIHIKDICQEEIDLVYALADEISDTFIDSYKRTIS